MSNELIKVTQLPVIEEQLRSLKDKINTRVAEAVALVCTEETVQTVKAARADLRKQFDELEEQRKAVKAAVLDPYNQFEQVYKECVSDAFKGADAALKQKIAGVESEIKRRCEEGLREYFAELCAAHHLDFLRYEQAGVKADMASAKQKTPKKLREQLAEFVARVSFDADRIADMEDAEEIMAEYKQTLNAVGAIGTVQERHRRIEEERAAKEAREAAKTRETEAIRKVEAAAHPIHEPPIHILRPEESEEDATMCEYMEHLMEQKETIFACTFTVHATKSQLRNLKEFMNQEGIQYE